MTTGRPTVDFDRTTGDLDADRCEVYLTGETHPVLMEFIGTHRTITSASLWYCYRISDHGELLDPLPLPLPVWLGIPGDGS